MVFPVIMYGCESWITKKAEHQRIDGFELWCWRRLLRVPWRARRSNQSILKEINPEYSLERLMLKLKLQYFSHLIWRVDSLLKTLMLGTIEGRRRSGWQDEMVGWHHRLNGHEFEQALGDSEGQGSLVCCSPWGHKELDTTERLTLHFQVPSMPIFCRVFNHRDLDGLISLLAKGLSGVFSSTTVRRYQFFGILPSLQSSSHNRSWPLVRP